MSFSKAQIAAVVAVLGIISACRPSEHAPEEKHAASRAPADSAAATEQFFEAAGRIDTITPNRKHVVVAHGDIPGFMDAMTMPFRLADTSVVSGLQNGDSVSFTVRVAGPVIEITEITPMPPR